MGMEMRTWATEKGCNHEGSGMGRCAIWRHQWGGGGDSNHKVKAYLGTGNANSPPSRPAPAL